MQRWWGWISCRTRRQTSTFISCGARKCSTISSTTNTYSRPRSLQSFGLRNQEKALVLRLKNRATMPEVARHWSFIAHWRNGENPTKNWIIWKFGKPPWQRMKPNASGYDHPPRWNVNILGIRPIKYAEKYTWLDEVCAHEIWSTHNRELVCQLWNEHVLGG